MPLPFPDHGHFSGIWGLLSPFFSIGVTWQGLQTGTEVGNSGNALVAIHPVLHRGIAAPVSAYMFLDLLAAEHGASFWRVCRIGPAVSSQWSWIRQSTTFKHCFYILLLRPQFRVAAWPLGQNLLSIPCLTDTFSQS